MQLKRLVSMCDLFLLNVILILFKVFGTAPFAVSINSNSHNGKGISLKISHSIAGCVYNLLLSLGFMVIIGNKMHFLNAIKYDNNPLIFIITNVYKLLSQIVVVIILITFGFNQRKLIRNINKLLYTNRLLQKTLGDSYHFEIRKHYIILFTLYYTFFLATTIFLVVFKIYERLLTNILHFIIANVILQYVLSFTYVQKVYHSINSHLLIFAKCQQNPMDDLEIPSSHCCLNINSSRNKIIFCRKIQSTLGEISSEFLEFFSWLILLTICISCGNLVYTAYKLVISLVLEKQSLDVDSCYWFSRTLNVIFLLVIVTGCINDLFTEIKSTSDVIYQLMSVYPEKSKIMFELEQFSMELLHRKQIEFTACGLFTLDRSLLASGSRIMFTYMILLIQAHFDRGLFVKDIGNSSVLNETFSTSISLLDCFGNSSVLNETMSTSICSQNNFDNSSVLNETLSTTIFTLDDFANSSVLNSV